MATTKTSDPVGLADAFSVLPSVAEVSAFVAAKEAPMFAHFKTVLSVLADAIRTNATTSVPGVTVTVTEGHQRLVAAVTDEAMAAAIHYLVIHYIAAIKKNLWACGLEYVGACDNGPSGVQLVVSYK